MLACYFLIDLTISDLYFTLTKVEDRDLCFTGMEVGVQGFMLNK